MLQVERAINNSVHSTTKQMPSKLLFGVEQRGEAVDEQTEYLEAYATNETTRNLERDRDAASKGIERRDIARDVHQRRTHQQRTIRLATM